MSVRRSLVVLTLLTLVLPVVVFGVRANRTESPRSNLQRYTVERGSVDVTVSAVGRIESDRSARLSFSAPGRVTEILVEQGDTVAEGDPLARLDDTGQQTALEQAQLGLQLAQLQKDRLLAGPDASQVAVAQAQVDSAMGAVRSVQNAVSPQDVQAAQLSYEQAQAALASAQHDRAFNGGTDEQVALLDARVGEASFNAEIARLNLESLQNGNAAPLNAAYARLNQAQAALDQVLAGASDADIDRADAAIAQAQVSVDRAQAALDRTILRAPFDGVVSAVNVEIGSLVASSVTAFEIADVSPLRLVVQVDEIDVHQISVGLPATVQFDALPGVTLGATLQDIALVPTDNNGIVSYDVTVRLSDDDPRVRAGMTTEASVVVDSRQDVLVVPNQYIRLDRQSGGAFVNVIQADGRLRELPVTLGLQGQDRSEITAGLQAGDVIAVDLSADQISLFGG